MRVRLKISYLGTAYHGWQVQDNAVTVQQKLEEAVERITGTRSTVTGCSRTDTGVHANCFYCAFSPVKKLDMFALPKALNAVLPYDIAVSEAAEVDDSFNPRADAKGKEYIYRIYNEYNRDPFAHGRSLHYRYAMNLDAMRAAAEQILGRHDFAAFCSSGSSVKTTVRTVSLLEIKREKSIVTVRIRADGFLYNMVRIIVGTLISVSEGDIPPDSVADIIESRDRLRAGPTAPPEGLYLNEVFY